MFLLTRRASLLRLVRHYGDSMTDYKHRRDEIGKFYKSKQWQQVRKTVLMRDKFLCRHCGKPATEVHHIIHLTDMNIWEPSIALNPDNLISLCWYCHRAEHRGDDGRQRILREENPYTFDANGMLVKKS